ncbi:MAG TPA: hypothetical protein VLE02_02990 [Nitrosarchaeum sp.]|nr:hypothetical protein [Nitrosarchaeum sp.]HXW03221.1 hypothetical protein [Nitrosarchaeum sp.]
MTTKRHIIMAVLAIGILGSIALTSQDISAIPQSGKDIIVYEKTMQVNPDLIRMQQIVDRLTDPELTESEKTDLYNEANDIRQKALSNRVILSEEKQQELTNAHEALNNIGSKNDIIGNEKFSDIIMGFGITEGKLLVAILPDKFTETEIPQIISAVRGVVGEKVDIQFEARELYTYSACSQDGDCNPLEGGAKIEAKNHNPCSATFQADKSGEGFITAGHCVDTGSGSANDVFQPTEDIFGFNKIGDVTASAYDSDTRCDCAFVDATESISDKIYNNISASAVGTVVEDDFLTVQGYRTGTLVGTVEVVPFSTTINGHFHRDHFTTTHDLNPDGGDSGGVLYESGAANPNIMGGVVADGAGDSLHWQAEYLDNEISGASFNFN